MFRNSIIFSFVLISFISCRQPIPYKLIDSQIDQVFKKNLESPIKNWHFRDIVIDTIPGISLNRAYDSILRNKKGKEVIVAVIDMEVDIKHKDLKNKIWININEIADNNLDDDGNGYIDDTNGWNFLGNEKGDTNLFVNYEYTRIVKRFNSKFKHKTFNEILPIDSLDYKIYKLAQKYYNSRLQFAIEDKAYANMISKSVYDSKKALSSHFENDSYSVEDLDSLKKVYPNDIELQTNILRRSNFMNYGFTTNYVDNYKLKAFERLEKLLNLEYNDRAIQGDSADNINDIVYGNNQMSKNVELLDHGTQIAGIISNIGLKNEIKIMPLSISAYGDEHDKDIALAIRYAVNNGAKVINMSFAKEFSLNYQWIAEAIKYAEKKNVLLVHVASNDGLDLDALPGLNFPNDHGYFENNEISNNFLTVAAASMSLDDNLKLSYSNYGKQEVDVFAPGENIYTYLPKNEFTNESGGTSSAAAVTSGLAALLYSYYPKLKANDIKRIIMESGIEYNIDVLTPTEKDKNITTPFNKISKSGKIINAYNALLIAAKR